MAATAFCEFTAKNFLWMPLLVGLIMWDEFALKFWVEGKFFVVMMCSAKTKWASCLSLSLNAPLRFHLWVQFFYPGREMKYYEDIKKPDVKKDDTKGDKKDGDGKKDDTKADKKDDKKKEEKKDEKPKVTKSKA